MAQSIQAISPPSSLVTAFKSHAQASEAPRTSQQGQNATDPFGPAVITNVSPLSGATLSAINEAAASASPPHTSPAYDSTGHSIDGSEK